MNYKIPFTNIQVLITRVKTPIIFTKEFSIRKEGSSKYCSIEGPRFDNVNDDNQPYGIKTGKVRPKIGSNKR